MRTPTIPSRRDTMRDLARRSAACRARGDWRGVELAAAAWHRLNGETDHAHAVAGLAKRIAARRARVPLDARLRVSL